MRGNMCSPTVSTTFERWNSPRPAPWLISASRSAPQKLVWMTSGARARSAEISAPNCPCEQFRELRVDDFHAGHEGLHGGGEVAPRILPPSVILVESGDALDVREHLGEVAGGGGVVHHRMRPGAEDVAVARLLEHPGRAAVDEDGKHPQLLRRPGNGEAIAARYVAHDYVDAAPLDQVAQFGDLLGGAAGLVHVDRDDPRPRQPRAGERRRDGPGVDRVDGEFRPVARRNPEMRRRRPGQETDDGDRDLAPVLGRRPSGRRRRQHGGHDRPQRLRREHPLLLRSARAFLRRAAPRGNPTARPASRKTRRARPRRAAGGRTTSRP